jgi:import inner membrane translocase subunit TIM17
MTSAPSIPRSSGDAQEAQHEHQHAPIHAMFPELLERHRHPARDKGLAQAARKVVDSTGTGFVYGTLFGSVLAAIEGVRESPKQQRMRGVLHHARVMVPETAGKIATVTCLFRVASLGLERTRGQRDMYNTLLAAPIAGGLLKARRGPKAALHSAAMFGSFAAVVLLFSKAEAAVVHHKASPEEVLEEIAFAEEMDDWDG